MDDKSESSSSISTIIKKFNDLSQTISTTLDKTNEFYSLSQKTDDSSSFLLSKFDSFKQKNEQLKTNHQQQNEETTYTIETLYKHANDRNSFTDDEPLIITRENTTAEQFQSIYEKQQSDKK